MFSTDHALLVAWFLVVIGVTGWAYWVSCKTNDAADASRQAADHAMAAAQDAHRAAMVLREWWSEAVVVDSGEPATQPIKRPEPPATVPEHRAVGRVDDLYLAHALADIEDRMRSWRQ